MEIHSSFNPEWYLALKSANKEIKTQRVGVHKRQDINIETEVERAIRLQKQKEYRLKNANKIKSYNAKFRANIVESEAQKKERLRLRRDKKKKDKQNA